MVVPLQGLPKWIIGDPLEATLGSATSLEERQGAEEVGVQRGCHPALGKLISLNAYQAVLLTVELSCLLLRMRPVEV